MDGYVVQRREYRPGRYGKNSYPKGRKYPEVKKQQGRCTFLCRYTEDNKNGEKDIMQGILFSEKHVLIGMDVWRLLNRMDTCEYPYRRYESIEAAKVTIVKEHQSYYMER